MQLTVREVSRLLGVTESTVTKWIKQRGLPTQHVAGQYRFNRAELLEWATTNRTRVSPEMFYNLESEDDPVPSLGAALEAGGIIHNFPDTSRDRVLRALVKVLPLPEGIDREQLLKLFIAREAAASTGVGDGIALPHVRNPIVAHVNDPLITLCFLEKPVDFGALDGQPVHVLFSLVCPTIRTHLQTLSRLSHALHDGQFKEAVLRHAPREQVLQEARRIDAALSAAGKAR